MEKSQIFEILDEIGAKMTAAGVVDKAETVVTLANVPIGDTYEYGGITDATGVHLYFRPSTTSEYVSQEYATGYSVAMEEIFTVRAVITAPANSALIEKNILLKEYLALNLSAAFGQNYPCDKGFSAQFIESETSAEAIFDAEAQTEAPDNPSFAVAAIDFKLSFTPKNSQCFTPKCNLLAKC